jgi:hypothetical protein
MSMLLSFDVMGAHLIGRAPARPPLSAMQRGPAAIRIHCGLKDPAARYIRAFNEGG